MIKRPTVFVLGAGAHVPYRFSTGEGLADKGRKLALNEMKAFTGGHLQQEELAALAEALADNFLPSIDALLERREDLRRAGKMLMLSLLLQEEAFALKERWASDEDWMSWIFEKMADGAATLEEFAENRVTFVTFNYDRLLEYRLIRGLAVRYDVPAPSVWAKIETLRPIHIYGSLGVLPEILEPTSQGQPLPFGRAQGPLWFKRPALRNLQQGAQLINYLGMALTNAETSINIVHDAVVEARRADVLKHLHSDGKQIFFFGFAFARQNVDWLQTRQIPSGNEIWMTTYGMTDSEFSDAVRPAFPQLSQWLEWEQHTPRVTIKQFLRDHVELFRS